MCGSAPQTVTYKHNMQDRKMEVAKLNLIKKWTKGALARRRLLKIILTKRL